MKVLFIIIFVYSITSVNALENSSNPSLSAGGNEHLSSSEMLDKAKSIQSFEIQNSITLANEVLKQSLNNNNLEVSAQAHSYLGELALESKEVVNALEHFLQASLIYKKMGDDRYAEADKVIDTLYSLAEQYGVTQPIAKILSRHANSDYKKKRYADAIVQYNHALRYLSGDDKKTHKERGKVYKQIAQSYKRLKKREETAFSYQNALAAFADAEDRKNMARTLNTLAEAERYLGNYAMSLDYLTQGLEIYKEIDDPEGRAKALTGAGIIYRYIGLYEKSLEHMYIAHQYYQEVKDVNGIASTSNQMGLIYTRLKQFEQARSFYQLTIDLPQEDIKAKTLASALREIAVIDLNATNYASAKEMATKAYEIYQRTNIKKNQALTARIIGNIYREEGNIPQAIVYYRLSLSLATDIGSQIYQVKALTPLAAMLFDTDVEESILLLNKALKMAEELDSTSSKLYVTREFRKAEKIRGNYQTSLDYAEQEILLKDLIQSEKDANELTLIKAKLYSHKKEMELASLKEKAILDNLELTRKNVEIKLVEKESKISDLKLTKNKYANMILVLLLLVSILLLSFIYRRFHLSKRHNVELNDLAARDPLTDCYNRRVLFDNIERYFDKSIATNNACIIMADIDHFKTVNDKYGHNAGDAVLCGVAKLFQDCVRQSDIVARFGGEEFCIILDNVPQGDALHIAETIRHKVENTRFEGIAVTCSFGVTSIQFTAKTSAELINQADIALYESKSLGRNRVTIWNKVLERND